MTAFRALSLTKLDANDRRALLILVGVVVFGLFLRVAGIGWSLPDARHPFATYHPDERINLNAALTPDLFTLNLDTGFYNYGALYFYLVNFAHILGRGLGWIPMPPQGATLFSPEIAPMQAALFLTGRWVMALMGTLTIAVVYFLGRRLYGRKAGLLGAVLYAIAPLAVVHSHFVTVDVPATLFIALALLWAARLLEHKTWANYVLAGIWTGLAAATKYNAIFVGIAPLLAHLHNREPDDCPRHRAAHLFVMLVAIGFAFLIGCPGPIINWDAFWNGTYPGSGVRYELFEHSRQGHGELFLETGVGAWYHVTVSLWFGMGALLLAMGLAGTVFACLRRTKGDWLLLAFLLLYFGTTSLSAVRFARYMIPLFPVLCLFAARLFTTTELPRFGNVPRTALATLTVLFTLGYTGLFVRAMTQIDPRDALANYLEANAPQGASLAFAKVPWFFLR